MNSCQIKIAEMNVMIGNAEGKYGSRQKGSIALQSCGLCFVHPDTGKPMAFSLPLPAAAPWKEFLELGE